MEEVGGAAKHDTDLPEGDTMSALMGQSRTSGSLRSSLCYQIGLDASEQPCCAGNRHIKGTHRSDLCSLKAFGGRPSDDGERC